MSEQVQERVLLKPAEVASRLGVAESTVWRYGRTGLLERVELTPRTFRYPVASVEALMVPRPISSTRSEAS